MAPFHPGPWPHVPIFDDETLYSWVGRIHRLSGNVSARYTNLTLFGAPAAGFDHDLPFHLGELVRRTDRVLGTDREMASRTILEFYLPYLRPDDATDAVASLLGSTHRTLKYVLSLSGHGAAAWHPLKACPRCVAFELARLGVSYWHRSHQWPSVWACGRHRCLLEYVVPSNGTRGRNAFVYPDRVAKQDWQSLNPFDGVRTVRLKSELARLAQITQTLICGRAAHYDLGALESTYATAMLGTRASTACQFRTRAQQAESLAVLSMLPSLNTLGDVPLHECRSADEILAGMRGSVEAFRHITLTFLLFTGATQFLSAYRSYEKQIATPIGIPSESPTRELFLNAITSRRLSIPSAATELGISAVRAHRWAKGLAKTPFKLSVALTPPRRAAMRRALLDGETRSQVAAIAGCGVCSVTAELNADPRLRQKWRKACGYRRRATYRKLLLKTIQSYPEASMAVLKTVPGSGFRWLMNHDRVWLLQASAK